MGKKRRQKMNLRPAAKGRPATPTKLRKLEQTAEDQDAEIVRMLADQQIEISKLAYKMFLSEGGGELDILMENGQSTARAYQSQIRAEEEGGQGWGPNITPYEDRMNRSLQLRLIREKQKWIEQCRQRIVESIKEAYAKLHSEPEETEEPDQGEAIEMEAGYEEAQSKPNLGSDAEQQTAAELQITTAGDSP